MQEEENPSSAMPSTDPVRLSVSLLTVWNMSTTPSSFLPVFEKQKIISCIFLRSVIFFPAFQRLHHGQAKAPAALYVLATKNSSEDEWLYLKNIQTEQKLESHIFCLVENSGILAISLFFHH